MTVKLSSRGPRARGACGSRGGRCQVSAHRQPPAEDGNLPPRHRHAPGLHLHPCNDTQMCMMSSFLGRKKRRNRSRKQQPVLGGKLTVLVNSAPWSVAAPVSTATGPSPLARDVSLAGGEVNGLVNRIWLGEPWARCSWLFQLRNTLQAPSAGESEPPLPR